ncbi:ATP-binding protein [Pedobacter sp. KR3-3]|uniref:histidine kinase n=1 Tax=Pedobacter albus TaxID=3113905 RepID=A0ABU7IC16_9SPHI|nr:ATP-binding protein [Pedobacter sp. KR3-3]MEE1947007.1 ATP-binding protein [Pedobacter sp. KR3-3]
MRLKIKYIAFIVIIHLVALALSYFVFEKDKLIFMIAEILVIFSILIAFNLYQQLIRPLNYLQEGINAIKDRDFTVKFLPTGKKEVDSLIGVYNQMIDELRQERTRQEEQHFFLEKLIHTSPTGIIILDYDRQVKQINPKAEEILNANPEILHKYVHQLQVGTAKIIRVQGLRTYKLQKSHFIDRGFERVFILLEEVTTEILETEKKVYSKVIRMMAHEVNNTIGPVNSIISTTLQTQDLWQNATHPQLQNALEIALDRNQNLNLFMRNLADLVKLTAVNRQQVDLSALLKSIAQLLHFNATQRGIVFEFDLPEAPFYIQADMPQMEQALLNIVKNATEAVNENGLIKFMLSATEKKLVIADNGPGISEEHSEQLFSPFFSTKKDGQGIGLTLVREILLNHGYEFSLKTIGPGQTHFTIYF